MKVGNFQPNWLVKAILGLLILAVILAGLGYLNILSRQYIDPVNLVVVALLVICSMPLALFLRLDEYFQGNPPESMSGALLLAAGCCTLNVICLLLLRAGIRRGVKSLWPKRRPKPVVPPDEEPPRDPLLH